MRFFQYGVIVLLRVFISVSGIAAQNTTIRKGLEPKDVAKIKRVETSSWLTMTQNKKKGQTVSHLFK